ncbi:MAG: sulfate transporter CysZ [Planctomycetes bacterium]|nr:sulfate transporter CysZ [Planctomycetota bacterium]
MTSLFRGASYFARGLGLIGKPRIRRWAFIPVVLSALIFAGLTWLSIQYLRDWVEGAAAWCRDTIGLDFLGPVLWVVFGSSALLVVAYSFVLVASLVACPFNAILAEAVEEHRTGRRPDGMPLLTMIKRSPVILFQETKKVLYYFLWAIPVGVLCLVLSPAAPFIWGAFSAWMMALEFSDYPMDNAGLSFRQMRRTLARRRMTAFGFGLAAFFFALVPLLNLLTVPAAVCGATLMWLEELEPLTEDGRR